MTDNSEGQDMQTCDNLMVNERNMIFFSAQAHIYIYIVYQTQKCIILVYIITQYRALKINIRKEKVHAKNHFNIEISLIYLQ